MAARYDRRWDDVGGVRPDASELDLDFPPASRNWFFQGLHQPPADAGSAATT